MNRKFGYKFRDNGKTYSHNLYARDEAEAKVIGEALYGKGEVDGQLIMEVPCGDHRNALWDLAIYYDNDGYEISREEWERSHDA